MEKFEVGKVVPAFVHHNEETKFDMDDSGATMLVFFNDPTQFEIDQFASGKNFEIRYVKLRNAFIITAKIGDLNWMDAPYTPHLSAHLTRFEVPRDGNGLGLTLFLIDAKTGTVKHMRLLGLSENFTKSFLDDVVKDRTSAWDELKYMKNLNEIFARYSTEDIARMSSARCKLN